MALTTQPRTWTYDDLAALPDDGRRYEIIEGSLFEMPAPSWVHVAIVMNLIGLLLPIVQSLGGQLATAPVDLFLPGADPVEPDILAILPGSLAIAGGRGVQGPPDVIVEVLSPSNRTHDLLTKRALYGRAGVREYWIVDPEARTVEVLTLERDALHSVRLAAGNDAIVSPLLDDAAFPLTTIFAGVSESRD
jgi:Uma2 family endonuclease